MTAAVSRWFLGLSGAELIAYSFVGLAALVVLIGLAVYKVAEWRGALGTWHDRWTLKNGPIRFEDRFL